MARSRQRAVDPGVAARARIDVEFRDNALRAAEDGNAEWETLDLLSHHRFCFIRAAVARNANAPAHVLERLAYDQDIGVLTRVAGNVRTPAGALTALTEPRDTLIHCEDSPLPASADQVSTLVRAVAENPSTPDTVLTELAYIGYAFSVASNPATPPGLLKGMAKKAFVEEYVTVNRPGWPNWPKGPKTVRSDLADLRAVIAKNPSTTAPALVKLFERGFVLEVAANPSTPEHVLVTIARDRDDWESAIGRALISNESLPLEAEHLLETTANRDVLSSLQHRRALRLMG